MIVRMEFKMYTNDMMCVDEFLTGVRLTFCVMMGFFAINSLFGWFLDPSMSEMKKTVDTLEKENQTLYTEIAKLEESLEEQRKSLRKEIDALEEDSISVGEKLAKITDSLSVILTESKLEDLSEMIETHLAETKTD